MQLDQAAANERVRPEKFGRLFPFHYTEKAAGRFSIKIIIFRLSYFQAALFVSLKIKANRGKRRLI
jgi:hypothetical protein